MEELVYRSDNFESIKNEIIKGGIKNLYVLADFDRTLTKALVNGKSRPSIISLLRSEGFLGEEYTQKAYALYNHYHLIEENPNIPISEKSKEMKKWWGKHLDLLIESGLTRSHIQKVVESSEIEFREGITEFLTFLSTYAIPLVIISANGIGGDSIEMFLKHRELLFKNISVISNTIIWDTDGKAIGRKEPLIHTFNKDQTSLKLFPKIYQDIGGRTNVILLGDSQGDTKMIGDLYYDNLLKIGFYNAEDLKGLEEHRLIYNMVLTGDMGIGEVNDILKSL